MTINYIKVKCPDVESTLKEISGKKKAKIRRCSDGFVVTYPVEVI